MQFRALTLGLCVLVAACTNSVDAALGDPPIANGTTTTEGSADTATTTLSEPAREPYVGISRALVLANGIVVPVLYEVDDRYSVHTPCGIAAFIDKSDDIVEVAGIDVVLDPGHGGDVETGAVGPNGLVEKGLNLDVARAAESMLIDRGYAVLLTRTDDYRVPLRIRAEIANLLDATVFVSIHHNAPSANRSPVPGTEIFVQSDSDESMRLGGLVYEYVVDALDEFDIDWVAASDAGALAVINNRGTDAYSMVRRPEMPAVLAEFGYISNASEEQFMATDLYVDTAATALTEAVVAWLETDDPGTGHVAEPRSFTPNGLTGGQSGCVDPDLGQ